MPLNRKLNYTSLSIEELRPGSMVYCWVMLTNIRYTNPSLFLVTDIQANTGMVKIEWSGALYFDVLNPTPVLPFQADKYIKQKQEIYHHEIRHITELRPAWLWNREGLNDRLLHSWGFAANAGGHFFQVIADYNVQIRNQLVERESVGIRITRAGERIYDGELWFVHELQNTVRKYTGAELSSDLSRRIMVSRPETPIMALK